MHPNRSLTSPLLLSALLGGLLCGVSLAAHGDAVKPQTAQAETAQTETAQADPGSHADGQGLEAMDVFGLEHISDPQVSPDGRRIVYRRHFMDVMEDRGRSNLWLSDGKTSWPVTTGLSNESSPRFSPDGKKLLYVATHDRGPQLFLRWLEGGHEALLTQLPHAPRNLSWSPDGTSIAFSMFVPTPQEPMADLPQPPAGAEWAPPAKVIDSLIYRADGEGYLDQGFSQIFVLSVDGGTPRQITSGSFQHGGRIAWTPDSRRLIFSANRRDDWQREPADSELYEISLDGDELTQLTDRRGPDHTPALSSDGRYLAFLGFDDRYQGFQTTELYVLDRQADKAPRRLTQALDRSVASPQWDDADKGLFFSYSDRGNGKVGYVSASGGDVQVVARDVGGTTLGRPYSSGSFHVGGPEDLVAFTFTRPEHPADLALIRRRGEAQRVTTVNADLLSHKHLAPVEEIWFESSHDRQKIQGWIAKPPHFDADKKYPLILEIHGGPFANYGDRFAAEIQLFAAAGYVTLYINPRGSTSYGQDFGNAIHHAYPGYDYDDLMSGVDAVIDRGYVDPDRLFVTGGSGGGVLTAWTVGKTRRFRAAVVAKPVINWYSFVLTADSYNFFYKYWFPGFPWDHAEHYMARSPLSLVGNIETPTMLLTGEADYRTPISESEQLYQALQLRGIDSAMVRIPEAGHGIAARPSNLISKVAHILAWFARYDKTTP